MRRWTPIFQSGIWNVFVDPTYSDQLIDQGLTITRTAASWQMPITSAVQTMILSWYCSSPLLAIRFPSTELQICFLSLLVLSVIHWLHERFLQERQHPQISSAREPCPFVHHEDSYWYCHFAVSASHPDLHWGKTNTNIHHSSLLQVCANAHAMHSDAGSSNNGFLGTVMRTSCVNLLSRCYIHFLGPSLDPNKITLLPQLWPKLRLPIGLTITKLSCAASTPISKRRSANKF